jgi:type I restriction enzyme S subunit
MTRPTATPSDDKPALTPKLRFPEFQEALPWNEVRLESILGVRDDRQLPDSEKPLYSLTIENGVTEKSDRYNREFLVRDSANKKYKLVLPADIVYNPSNLRWGAINYSRLSHPVVVSPIYEVLFIKNRSKDCLEFIARSLMRDAQIKRFITKGQGTLVERIAVKIDDFISTGLPVPPTVAEQQKIAECLSTLDELIGAESQKFDALKAHKKGLMQQLFPREGETLPRLRFPEFHSAPEWEQKPLGDFVEVASGQVDPKEPPYCDFPQIGSENIESDSGKIVNVRSAREKGVISGNYVFDKADILYSKIRPALNKVAAPNFKGVCSADIYPIRPASDRLLRGYLFFLLLSDRFLEHAIRSSDRGKIPKINREALLTYEAQIPKPAEQHRIATCLSSLDDLIAAQSDRLAALQTHKQGLLQQLFPSPAAPDA